MTKQKKNIMQSYLKYIAYYEAKAAPLTTTDYCYILNPKADTQATKIPVRELCWIGPYKVEKVLHNNNYTVRWLGTNKTQLLHRIRLRKFTPSAPLANNFALERLAKRRQHNSNTQGFVCPHLGYTIWFKSIGYRTP